MRDDSCPTCGSKDFGQIEMRRESDLVRWKVQCYNCKKFWFDVKGDTAAVGTGG